MTTITITIPESVNAVQLDYLLKTYRAISRQVNEDIKVLSKSSKEYFKVDNMEQLKDHLQERIKFLKGDWIRKNSGYDEEACINLGFNCQTKRYWDCEYNGLYIEIKKGKSIWLDEVRYSEIYMKDNDECKKKTITIFLIPSKDKNKIENIIIIDTQKIIDFLQINTEWAKNLLSRRKIIRRSLNCQQSMTIKDAKSIADYIV